MYREQFSGLNRFLLASTPASGLAVVRILFFGWLFLWYFKTDFSLLSMGSQELWQPLHLLRVTRLDSIPSKGVLVVVSMIWKSALLLSCVGLLTRVSIGISFLFGAYLLALTHSFWKINHSDGALVLAMGVLMFSRCGDRFSLDRLVRELRLGSQMLSLPEDHSDYRWPVRLVQIILVVVFFNSGVSKIVNGGLPWIAPDNLYGQILQGQLIREPLFRVDLPFELLKPVFVALSLGAIVLELAAPLALFSNITAIVIIPALLAMQIGIRLFMGDDFSQFASLYLFWVPWGLLGGWVLGSAHCRANRTLLFDGSCGMCLRTMKILKSLDVFRALECRDVVAEWPDIATEFPKLNQVECLEDMHVITRQGRIYKGFFAYRSIAWSLPLFWFFLPVLYFPGVSLVGGRIYFLISRRRLERGCAV